MRIGMLCSNYVPHPGGLEVMVQNLSRGLARNHDVVLVTSGWAGNVGRSEESGISVHRLPATHITEQFGVPYPVPMGPGVASAVRALEGAQVIHVHGALYASSVLGALLSRTRKTPLVLTEHVGFVEYRRPALNAVQRAAWTVIGDRVVGAADAVATYNTRVQEWLRRRFPDKNLRYIGNGVDFASFRPRDPQERGTLRESFGLPKDKVLVLYAGRASEKKNLDSVLQIPRDRFHLVVCGWKRELRAPGLTDLGVLPHAQMPALFGCVDLMVHASVGEGLPLAVQEAIASAVPVVLLWDDGYTGWISQDVVDPHATLEDVKRGVCELAESKGRRAELSTRARAWAEGRWSWDATIREYVELYRQAMAKKVVDG